MSDEERAVEYDERAPEADTDLSWCLVFDGVKIWMPKSRCRIYQKSNKVYAPVWLLKKNDLI